MKIRTLAVAVGTCAALLTAGCSSQVSGQAQIASGAVVPASTSAPSPFPDPTSSGSTSSESSSSESSSSDSSTSESSSSETESTESTDSTDSTETSPSSTNPDDTSVGPTSAPSIPGLSKDCNAVLAGITAFSKVLQGASSTGTITQAAVDEALRQLPESGLPARPQADITVLRTTVSGAAGKSLPEFSQALGAAKVIEALQDLSSWAEDNCLTTGSLPTG